MKYILLYASFVIGAMPALSRAYVEEPDIKHVAPELRTGHPVWTYEKVSVGVSMDCHIKYGILDWPKDALCYRPELTVDLPRSLSGLYDIYIGEVNISRYSENSYEEMRSALEYLLSKQFPYVELIVGNYDSAGYSENTAYISLSGFASAYQNYKTSKHQEITKRLDIERQAYAWKSAGMLIAGILGGVVFWVVCRVIWLKLLPTLGRNVLRLVRSLKRMWSDWRARRLVMHESMREAVRHNTRAQLEKADESDQTLLRRQIHSALEKGDNELAEALLKALRRMNANKS